ncbi:MAG TPA: HDIG domain-containing protein [Anaerolineales bacterium]|nr:HDIG domain-containing protein [Anaerolineales bacterium]
MENRFRLPLRIRSLQIFVLVAVSIVTFAALTLPVSLRPAALPLQVGDVAPRDITAPGDDEYVSQILTEEARQTAEKAVQPVYTDPDPAIAREQISRLSATFQLINFTRADTTSTDDVKQAQLANLNNIDLKPDSIKLILSLSDSRWDAVQQESLRLLEQVMRSPVRTDNLDAVQASIPSLVDLTFSDEEAGLVTEFVGAFVVTNSHYSADLTAAAQKSARDAVQPLVQTYKAGERIVSAGEIITPAQMEALQEFKLIQPSQPIETYLGAGALTILSAAFIGLYFLRRRKISFLSDPRSLLTASILWIVFIAGARFVIPNRAIVPYLYPLPAAGLLLTTLFGMESGIILSLVISMAAAYGLPNTLELMPFYVMASLCGVLMLGPARRFWGFFRAGLVITGAGIAVILAYVLPSASMDWTGIITLIIAALVNGLASASIALLLQYPLAQFLNLPTSMQLLEISHPDFPLLQMFLRNAPGTYQHSLQVANLAEQAAEAIGADSVLTRVGALFHDIGKAKDASFFVENQAPGNLNTHVDITPQEAAQKIIQHVHDGVALAHKYHLPHRIDDFILEHHGTMLTRYQYNQALEKAGGDAGKVDMDQFRYPGPRPHSRETAILMIADGSEARARAEGPESDDDLRAIVRSVVERIQKENQLDNAPLTMRDLSLITDSVVTTLRGTYHPRIQYPAAEPPAATTNVQTDPLKAKKT